LIVVVSLAQPWPLAFLVDSALGDKAPPEMIADRFGSDPSTLILVAVAAGLVVTVGSSFLSVFNSYTTTRLDQQMVLNVRSELFQHVQKLSLAFHDNKRKGMLMFAINNQAAAVGRIATSALPIAQGTLTVIGMFIVAFRIEPILALLAITVVPFIYYSTTYYSSRIQPKLRVVREMEGTSLSIVHEAMSMIKVIVAFGREPFEHSKFWDQGSEAVEERIKVTVRQTGFSLGVTAITAVGTALVLGVGAHRVLSGSITVGELLVILSYISAVYKPLEQVSNTFAALQEQLMSLEAVVDLLDKEPEVSDPVDGQVIKRARGQIEFRDVGFSYSGRKHTLQDINLEVKPGTTVGIVGPTGAGKSTLVSLIPRFFDPQRGEILLDGRDIRTIRLESLRNQLAIVLQEPLLFSGTIADNIRYGRLDASDREVIEAARDANAHDFIAALPNGYETRLGERGAQLSGGERQRISVARAFLKDAPVLILDEPTSSVDSRTEAVILEALERLAEGRTTLMIAHRLSTIRRADHILVLGDGRTGEQGTHDDLVRSGGVYAEMWLAQVGGDGYDDQQMKPLFWGRLERRRTLP
jgi:ABC-type multidrug transport system fused ATPase/permease subunit